MIPYAIYYTPGARGDFLSSVIENNISNLEFKTLSTDSYIKLHDADQFTEFKKHQSSEYVIRITTKTAKELIDVTLLHFIKNQTQINYNLYDLLFIVAKNTYIDQQRADKFTYSYSISFSDLNNISAINQLLVDFLGKNLTTEQIWYIDNASKINSKYLTWQYCDLNIQKTLDLLDFEINGGCLTKTRIFSFDEYLNSNDYKSYLHRNCYF